VGRQICSGRGYLSAFVFVVLRRSNPLSIESNRLYICSRVRVFVGGGGGGGGEGVKKNVIRELKPLFRPFYRL